MKIILVDAIHGFVIKGQGMFGDMYKILEQYPNRKIVLTGAKKEQFKELLLNNLPYEIFTLEHDPEKTDPKYYETMLAKFNLNAEDVIYFKHSKEAIKC